MFTKLSLLSLRVRDQTLEEGDGDGDTPVAKNLQELTATANRDRDELDDERQLRQLQKDLQHEDREDASRWGAAPEEVCMLNMSPLLIPSRGWITLSTPGGDTTLCPRFIFIANRSVY